MQLLRLAGDTQAHPGYKVLANIDHHTVASDAMQALPAGKICALACLSTFAGLSYALPAREDYMPARTSRPHAAVYLQTKLRFRPPEYTRQRWSSKICIGCG